MDANIVLSVILEALAMICSANPVTDTTCNEEIRKCVVSNTNEKGTHVLNTVKCAVGNFEFVPKKEEPKK